VNGAGAAQVNPVAPVLSSNGLTDGLATAGDRLAGFALGQLQREKTQQTTAGRAAGLSAWQQGQALETKDETTELGQAFNAGALSAYAAGLQVDMRQTADRLASEADSPQAYSRGWAAYQAGLLGKIPENVRPVVEIAAMEQQQRGFAATTERFRRVEKERQSAVLNENLDGLGNEYRAAMRRGDTKTAESIIGQTNAMLEGMITSGHLSGAQAAHWRTTFADQGAEQLVMGQFDAAMKQGYGAAAQFVESFAKRTDGDPIQRDRLVASMSARVSHLAAQARAADAGLARQVRAALDVLDSGYAVDLAPLERAATGTAYAPLLAAARQDQEYVKAFSRQAPASQQAVLDELGARLESGELPIEQAEHLGRLRGRLERAAERGKKALADDALSYTAAVNGQEVPLIDWQGLVTGTASADSIKAAIEQRVALADTAEAQFGAKALPLTKAELRGIGEVIAKSPAEGQRQLLGLLQGSLPEAQFLGVVEAIAPSSPAFVAAAALSRQSPEAADAVLHGEEVRKAMPAAAPAEAKLSRALDDTFGTLFANSPKTRAITEAGIRAAYTRLAAEEGDSSGDVANNPDRLERAVTLVTGGVVSYRGQVLLPPIRGMDQDDFDDLLDSLSDKSFVGAVSLDGSALDAKRFQRYGTLEQAGEGRYLVRLPTGYAVTATGAPFILDLAGAKLPPSVLQLPDLLGAY
jgi:hypothetical protein